MVESQAVENDLIKGIAEDVSKDVGFIPVVTIISIIVSTIRLIWDCSRPRNIDEAKKMLVDSYDGSYNRRTIIATQRAVLKATRERGQSITRAQANDMAIKILDGIRNAPIEQLPNFDLI